MPEITPKELKIINSISRNSDVSQRDVASDIGVSLGLTNILINRLVMKGYLKAKRLDARKIKYIITPRGLKEKAHKTYQFMSRSFSVINRLKDIIQDFAVRKYKEGKKDFLILGDGELSKITELVLNSLDMKDIKIRKMGNADSSKNSSVILNTNRADMSGLNDDEINIWETAERLYGSNYEF